MMDEDECLKPQTSKLILLTITSRILTAVTNMPQAGLITSPTSMNEWSNCNMTMKLETMITISSVSS